MDDFYFTAGDCTLVTSTPYRRQCVCVCVCVCGQCHPWDLFTKALNTVYTQSYFEFCEFDNKFST